MSELGPSSDANLARIAFVTDAVLAHNHGQLVLGARKRKADAFINSNRRSPLPRQRC